MRCQCEHARVCYFDHYCRIHTFVIVRLAKYHKRKQFFGFFANTFSKKSGNLVSKMSVSGDVLPVYWANSPIFWKIVSRKFQQTVLFCNTLSKSQLQMYVYVINNQNNIHHMISSTTHMLTHMLQKIFFFVGNFWDCM